MQETELRARGGLLLRRPHRGRPLPAARSSASLPCGFVPALSEDSNGWKGESGLITDVVDRLEGDITEVDAYVCGPPPMVEATIALLEPRACPRRTSTTTSSPPPRTSEETHGHRGQGTQRPQACVHGRRGGGARSSPPGRAAATTTSSRASAARRSTRTSRSTSSPTPTRHLTPGLGLLVRQRRRRLPAGVVGAEVDQLARVPRSQRGVGADDLSQQRERRPPDLAEHRARPHRARLPGHEPGLGAGSSSATCSRGRTWSRASGCTSTRPPSATHRRT